MVTVPGVIGFGCKVGGVALIDSTWYSLYLYMRGD